MMDQGPVLVITFTSQQIMVVRDMKGTVVEGDPVSITYKGNYEMALNPLMPVVPKKYLGDFSNKSN